MNEIYSAHLPCLRTSPTIKRMNFTLSVSSSAIWPLLSEPRASSSPAQRAPGLCSGSGNEPGLSSHRRGCYEQDSCWSTEPRVTLASFLVTFSSLRKDSYRCIPPQSKISLLFHKKLVAVQLDEARQKNYKPVSRLLLKR